MNKEYFQSLVEGVRKRVNSPSVPVYHKDSPIGKFVSRETHDAAIKNNNPFQDTEFLSKISKGVKRGKIGNTKNISYTFTPRVKHDRKNKQVVLKGGTESGHHVYDFKTSKNDDVHVRITHDPVTSLNANVRGIFNKSRVVFDVNGMTDRWHGPNKGKNQVTTAVEAMRGVLSALHHHVKSHNPDMIHFTVTPEEATADKRNRLKLYKYLINKMAKKNYDVKTVKSRVPYGNTQIFLYNKKSRTKPEVESAVKRLVDFRTKKTINKNKEQNNGK